MPLFYQHNINDATKLAVWHITESEDFFLTKAPLQKEISHPHKRLQHLAGRYLLEILEEGFPFHLIEISDAKKPLLSGSEFHFSVSHCGDYAAAIVSKNKLVGIDVELITPKIERVKNKFLSENEIDILPENSTKYLTLFWSAKEAMFKWYGKGEIDFKKNLVIDKLSFGEESGFINAHFEKEKRKELTILFNFLNNLCLAWISQN
ncbi:MAG: 4'-phosphopantetheinyl transferase superfamily protein [Ginsengibacter sp.]